MSEKEKRIDRYIYILVFFVLAFFLGYYLHISVGKLPMMDYWLYIDTYIEDVMTNSFKTSTFINIPHALHWNPFNRLFNYFFVRFFLCDNRAYVYGGMFFSLLSIMLLIVIYRKYLSSNKGYLNAIGVTICTMPIVNLNQWEIYTLYCNFSFMARIFTYLLLIYLLEKIIRNNDKISMVKLLCFEIINCIVILFMSQAYFVGLIAAEIAVLTVDFIICKNINKIKYYFTVFMSALIGAVVYYITLDKSSASTDVQIKLFERISDFFQGILVMLGSVVIPQTVSLDNMTICCEVGLIILELAIVAVYLFFKTDMYKKTFFPLACLVYAFTSIVVIIFGRLYTYGIGSLTSSRYVVETTVGLVGLVQIYWYCICEVNIKVKARNMAIPILISIGIMLCWSNKIELGIGPYRKAYNDNMISLAYDIENVSDEQLRVFQAPPDRVREGLRVMKKYNLCIYND